MIFRSIFRLDIPAKFCKMLTSSSSHSTKTAMRTYLFWFSNEHSNFRFAELEALFKVCNLDRDILEKRIVNGPFILMDFPDESGPVKLMSRSFLAHSCYELWASGQTLSDLHKDMKQNLDNVTPYIHDSFQIRVDSYGKTIKHAEKLSLINTFEFLPLEGKVDLKEPSLSLYLIPYYGLEPNDIPEEPYQLYFGRWIMNGQRKVVSRINLKDRKFIGNTSMDPLLSLLMANLALVKENDVVLDPFVGTGSLLVAAGVLNAYVIGNDIDYLMIHAKTASSRAFTKVRDSDESVRANLKQYGAESQYLDVVVADTSRPLWRNDFKFDAIITDPPYGIREATERIGTDKHPAGFKIKEEHLAKHIPAKISYTLQDIFSDLLNFSAQSLNIGGRLALWIPISRTEYDEEKLPRNPALSLVSNCEQCLTATASRRLLVYEKIREPSETCLTEMDGSALMYRFKFFELEANTPRKEKKSKAYREFGKATKRGQLQPS